MLSRDENIDREARDLWQALRKDAPPAGLTGADLLRILVAQAAELRYDRYASPHLRESQITRPRAGAAAVGAGRDGRLTPDTRSTPPPLG